MAAHINAIARKRKRRAETASATETSGDREREVRMPSNGFDERPSKVTDRATLGSFFPPGHSGGRRLGQSGSTRRDRFEFRLATAAISAASTAAEFTEFRQA